MQAPAAIKLKNAPKLDRNGLEEAYAWFPVDRDYGFRLAFLWLSQNAVAMINEERKADPTISLTTPAYDRAVKAKELGDRGTTQPEKEAGWTTALRLWEGKIFPRTWAKMGFPKVDEALAASVSRAKVPYLGVLQTLGNAFRNHVRFGVSPENSRAFPGENTIQIPADELRQMAEWTPMRMVLNEVPLVAQVASAPNGKLDGELFMENLPKVLAGVYSWAETASCLFTAGKAPAAPRAAASAPRMPRVAGVGKCPFGLFKVGTIWADLTTMLSDRQEHRRDDLLELAADRGEKDPAYVVSKTIYLLKKAGVAVDSSKRWVKVI